MKNLILIIAFSLLTFSLSAKEYFGSEAQKIIKGANKVRINGKTDFPNYIVFSESYQIPVEKFGSWMKSYLKTPNKISFKQISIYNDKIGFSNIKFQQLYDNIPINNAVFTLHAKNNKIISISGNIFTDIKVVSNAVITVESAIDIAKNKMNAISYKWEIQSEEKQLKLETKNSNATYYPSPNLQIFFTKSGEFKQVYNLTIYSHKPIDKKEYFIDASTGNVLDIRQKLYAADINGTAVTKYSGNQTITADSYSGSYRLRETGRGNGIETYNCGTGTSYGAATDFTDADNYWNNFNAQLDEAATDAQWASEKTYDFFFNNFGFNSIDNAGFKLINYVHYDVSYGNAFWDGTRMTYGDGSSAPFTTVDIAGHEVAHGLTEFNAGLIYQDESGALNEGYSDIFGTAIEFYAKPSAANWTIAEDLGSAFRSLQNPNAFGDPDTYLGTNWYTGTGDNGGVHTNSQVIGHWFYLLSVGGSGTNDIGNTYAVTGIGITDAQAIAFRTLTVYLTPNSTYNDAKYYSIVSAIDLFGACTPQVEATTNAMYAVGLGSAYVPTVIADFTAPVTSGCITPFTVNFQNISSNASSFIWDFGDGNTSTLVNPSHAYNTYGNFNVTLSANGGACGTDVTLKSSYISVSTSNPCIVQLPLDGTAATQTMCNGKLFDGGGPTGNYADMSDAIITISPSGATDITLNFISFDVEPGDAGYCNYDYLQIFDGPNTSSTSLGQWCNLTGAPGIITTTGGSVTILLHSDQALNLAGFEMDWTCSMASAPPAANFSNTPISTCIGNVSFTDQSSNGPTTWLWDFGDGSTSTLQNPSHTYNTNGTYNVSLTVTNTYGSDNITNNNLVTVNKPIAPSVNGGSNCGTGTVGLSAIGSGVIHWFNASSGGTDLGIGNSYTTPSISSTTTYYAEDHVVQASQYVGNTQSSLSGSTFTATNEHYLIFDCLTPCILVSVEVNASTAGNRIIELRDASGATLQTTTVNILSGVSRINLNFNIPIGTNLRLVGPGSPNLWRNDAGVSFPYAISGLVSINNSDAGTAYYYYFYDWEIKEPDCISPRVPVVATINPVLTTSVSINASSTTICQGDLVTFNANPLNGGLTPQYQWQINGNNFGANSSSITSTLINNNDVVTCILTSSESCVNSSSATSNNIIITVNPLAIAGFSLVDNGLGNVSFTDASQNSISWNWNFGDGVGTSTTASPNYTYLADGTYTITQVVTNSCGSDTNYQTIAVIVLNVQAITINSQIQIYPNPFNDKISIITNSDIITVSITDILGKQLNVKNNILNSKNVEINTKDFAQGIYFISIETINTKITRKIIKE